MIALEGVTKEYRTAAGYRRVLRDATAEFVTGTISASSVQTEPANRR